MSCSDPATTFYNELLAISQKRQSSFVPPSAIPQHIGQKASIARLVKDGRIASIGPDGTLILRPPLLDSVSPASLKPQPQNEYLLRKFMAHSNTIPAMQDPDCVKNINAIIDKTAARICPEIKNKIALKY